MSLWASRIPANDLLPINWLQNLLNSIAKSGELDMPMGKCLKDGSWVNQLR